MRTRRFPASFDFLDQIREFVGLAARDSGLDDRAIYAVQMAVDEACSNIIEHAYAGRRGGEIEVICTLHPDDLTVVLRDQGRTFNPDEVPVPDLTAPLEEREIGGLGVYLIRELMDEVFFESVPGVGNVLTLIKRKKAA